METPPKTLVDLSAKLYNSLENLRTVLLREAGEGVMPYHIFANATMKQMCEEIPRTLEELRDIHGIGDVKVIKRVLETIEATIDENINTDQNNSSSEMETPSKPHVDFSNILYTALGKLRTALVKEAGNWAIADMIFPNTTMKQMCERIPRTLKELRDIHGIGSVKLNKYGARVLETIEATIKENAEAYKNNKTSNERSDSVKQKRDQSEMKTPSKPQVVFQSELSEKLYTALKKLRTHLLKEAGEGVIAYHIFHHFFIGKAIHAEFSFEQKIGAFRNATMKQMCEKIPRTLKELRRIHGIGERKLNKYGARVLETIEATIKENANAYENNTDSNGRLDPVKPKKDRAEGDVDFVKIPSNKMDATSKPQVVESEFSAKLYTALKKLRKALVKEAGEGIYLYHIFPNATMKQMSEKVPRSMEELREIHGIGHVKLNKYGDRVLETIEATIKKNAKAYEKNINSYAKSDSPHVVLDFSSKLYNALRKLRTVLVNEAGEGVFAYHIFTNATLKQMCEKVPRTVKELLDIHGISNVKVNMYGARVLETIGATIEGNTKPDTNYYKDSAKRGRDLAECDDDLVNSIGRSIKRVSIKQFPGAEVVDDYETELKFVHENCFSSDIKKVGVNGGLSY